jgi:hypothetical protein
LGGIPALDEQLRPEVYQQGGPRAVNDQARANMQFPPYYFNGQFGNFREGMVSSDQSQQSDTNNGNNAGTADPFVPTPTPWFDDQGIVPTPTSGWWVFDKKKPCRKFQGFLNVPHNLENKTALVSAVLLEKLDIYWNVSTIWVKTSPIMGPRTARMTITTTATKTKMRAYSTKPWPSSRGLYIIMISP